MKQLKEKFQRFMAGRYGNDKLNQFLLVLVLALILVNVFVQSRALYWLELIGLVFAISVCFQKTLRPEKKKTRCI